MPKFVALIAIFFTFIIFQPKVFAASINVSSTPANLNQDQEFTVQVQVTGAAAGTTNYLRGAFYSADSPTSYFGYSYNNSNWYNGTPTIDPHQFLQIQIQDDGTWSGDLKAKADIADSAFKGEGNYFFKVGRYTANASSVTDWSSGSQISISAPDPSPSPSSTLNPSPSPTASISAASPKNSTQNSIKTSPATSTNRSIASPSVLGDQSASSSAPPASPISSFITPAPSNSPEGANSKFANFAIIGGSVLVIISLGAFLWYKWEIKKTPEDKPETSDE